jgi:hypothetical protein
VSRVEYAKSVGICVKVMTSTKSVMIKYIENTLDIETIVHPEPTTTARYHYDKIHLPTALDTERRPASSAPSIIVTGANGKARAAPAGSIKRKPVVAPVAYTFCRLLNDFLMNRQLKSSRRRREDTVNSRKGCLYHKMPECSVNRDRHRRRPCRHGHRRVS